MHVLRAVTPLAMVGALALSTPALASPGHHAGAGGDAPSVAQLDRSVPSRIATSIKRADRALARVEERLDDGEVAKAVSAIDAAQSGLATAQRSARRTVAANGAKGPAAAWAVLDAEDETIAEAVSLLGGVSDDTAVTELAELLAAQTSGRDALVAAIGALTAEQRAAYASVLEAVAGQLDEESAAIDEALLDEEDDALTQGARDALIAAKTAIAATDTAVAALLGTSGTDAATGAGSGTVPVADDSGTSTTTAASGRGDCPERGDRFRG